MSWRPILTDLIDHELIIADALEKEIKLTDSEVRETMEERFGPNIIQTLDKIGLTYDEAWKMIKNEMIVQRMNWWFVQQKAQALVTPQAIKDAYRAYLEKNPCYTELKYRVVTVDQKKAEKLYQALLSSNKDPSAFDLQLFDATVSNEFVAKTEDLSLAHKQALASLLPHTYSKPIPVEKKGISRIFYLYESKEHPAPSFEVMTPQLKTELLQAEMLKTSNEYLAKLRKKYGFTPTAENALPEDLHPFSLQ